MSAASAPNNDWQRLWFAARQQSWSSLALVPSEAGLDVAQVAETLAETGRLADERPVSVLNAQGVRLADMHQFLGTLGTMTGRGDWVIVPVDPIVENPSAAAIAQATSASLLVVRLGESFLTSARHTIEVVGRHRFLGSVVLNGRGSEHPLSIRLTVP